MATPLAALLLLFSLSGTLALRICSFNVRSFGESKIANQNAMEVIVKVSPFLVRRINGHPSHPLYCFQT